MSDENGEGEEETQENVRTIKVITEKGETYDEPDKYKELLEQVAEKAFSEAKESLSSKHPEFSEEIEDATPERFEALKTVLEHPKRKKASVGSVVLQRREAESPDPIEQLLTTEFDSYSDMMSELQNINSTKLTVEQRHRLSQIKDQLWQKYNRSPSQDRRLTIVEKIPDFKEPYMYKCGFCGEYIPHSQRILHSSTCGQEGREE